MANDVIDPSMLCADCDKPWIEHFGFNCDRSYADRKWKPLLAGTYPPNLGDVDHLNDLLAARDRELAQLRAEAERWRPVVEAAKVAASGRYTERRELAWDALNMAVRTAIAAEASKEGKND